MKYLVTAVGGDIGQAVVRILRRLDEGGFILGTDLYDDHAGRYRVDKFEIVPQAGDPSYVSRIVELSRRHEIDFVIPINEYEIQALKKSEQVDAGLRSELIVARGPHVDVCFDKFVCNKFLESKGIPLPWTQTADKIPPAYPCILKRRHGSGSKGLHVLQNEEEYRFFSEREKGSVLQQLLLPDSEEYTCGVFRARGADIVRVIVLKRKLFGGLTGSATVIESAPVEDYCKRIAEALGLEGAVNVQLRLTKNGPRMFEINPRFSSTVGFRDAVGFRDLLWSMQQQKGDPIDPFDSRKAIGKRFYRFFDEMYI